MGGIDRRGPGLVPAGTGLVLMFRANRLPHGFRPQYGIHTRRSVIRACRWAALQIRGRPPSRVWTSAASLQLILLEKRQRTPFSPIRSARSSLLTSAKQPTLVSRLDRLEGSLENRCTSRSQAGISISWCQQPVRSSIAESAGLTPRFPVRQATPSHRTPQIHPA